MTPLYSRIIKLSFKRRFFMARLTKVSLIGDLVERLFFQEDKVIILPKDTVAEKVLSKSRTINMAAEAEPESTVLPSQIIDELLRRSRYIYIMNSCLCRNSNGCRDYPHELGCIFLGRGTLKINEGMGHMATKEEAMEHMRKAREAGLIHLVGRGKIDSVWLGTKEDLLTICNCCPCCCLWKITPYLTSSITNAVTRMPGVSVKVDGSKCTGCGRCVKEEVCYVKALSLADSKARVNQDWCKGCGRCVEFCAQKAIELTILQEDFFDEALEQIEPLVDIEAE